VNEAYCRYFGRTREALQGTRFLVRVPESERACVRRRLATLMETGTCRPQEHRVYRADGSIGWQQWSDHVIRGDDGRVVELQGLGRDITERALTIESAPGRGTQVRAGIPIATAG
jgi:PAS domain S-box-containing protein